MDRLEHHHRRQRHRAGMLQRRVSKIEVSQEEQQRCGGDGYPDKDGSFPQQRRHYSFIDGARRSSEDAFFARLERESDILNSVRDQVHPDDLGWKHRQREPAENGNKHRDDNGHARGEQEEGHVSDVVEDHATFLYGGNYCGEVVVSDDDVTCLFGNVGAP